MISCEPEANGAVGGQEGESRAGGRGLCRARPSRCGAARTHDLAGQETSEIHGQGSPQQVTWAAYTRGLDGEKASVADANNNIMTLGYGYDPGGRETSRTSTNAAYVYTPPVKSSAYTANSLSQYPTVNSYSRRRRSISALRPSAPPTRSRAQTAASRTTSLGSSRRALAAAARAGSPELPMA